MLRVWVVSVAIVCSQVAPTLSLAQPDCDRVRAAGPLADLDAILGNAGGAPSEEDDALKAARAIRARMNGPTTHADEIAILSALARQSDLERADTLRFIDLLGANDGDDLVHMMSDDVDDADVREELSNLIAAAQRAEDEAFGREIGIISDIDDTALSQYYDPEGTGMFRDASALYDAIEHGRNGQGAFGDVHFVTGRPRAFGRSLPARLRGAGFPEGTKDWGSLGGLAGAMLANIGRDGGLREGANNGLQAEKISDVERLLALHPNQSFIFFGDNMQRDPAVYEYIAEHHPSQVEAIFIHRAGGERQDSANDKVQFISNYSEAWDVLAARGIVPPRTTPAVVRR